MKAIELESLQTRQAYQNLRAYMAGEHMIAAVLGAVSGVSGAVIKVLRDDDSMFIAWPDGSCFVFFAVTRAFFEADSNYLRQEAILDLAGYYPYPLP